MNRLFLPQLPLVIGYLFTWKSLTEKDITLMTIADSIIYSILCRIFTAKEP
jgi:hypothetical protein